MTEKKLRTQFSNILVKMLSDEEKDKGNKDEFNNVLKICNILTVI